MGLFGKKRRTPEDWLASYPVRQEHEYLLTLGTPLVERDAGEYGSLVLADPRGGKGAKYLFPMWGVHDSSSLELTVADLVSTSRSPQLDPEKASRSQTRTVGDFAKAVGGAPLPGCDFSGRRVSQVTDLGAMHLEYAAYLVRLEMGMPWGNESHAVGLLQALHGEVRQRFATWPDYMISADVARDCVEAPFGFPTAAPVYVRLLRLPGGYFAKHPLR